MRVVVMDEDMREPITVVEIPHYLMREAAEGRLRVIKVPAPLRMSAWMTLVDQIPNVPQQVGIRIVSLRMEPIWKGNEILYWVAVPDDPELALLLRAAFLPGQMTELQRREAQAWFSGALSSLR